MADNSIFRVASALGVTGATAERHQLTSARVLFGKTDLKSRPPWLRYSAALVCIALAVFIRWLLDPLLGNNLAFLTIYGGVAFAVWFGGWRPAVLAAFVGFLATDYLFFPPRLHLGADFASVAGLAGYSVSCALIIYLGESMHRALQRSGREITERTRADEMLRAKEAELEAIISSTPVMLTRCSRDLCYRFVSDAYATMLGRTPEEIAGKPIVEIMGEEGLKIILPHVEKVLKGHRVEYETEVSYRGLRALSMHCAYTPDRDEEGNVIGWFASITDVTERKEAEAALKKSKSLLEERVRERTRALRAANEELGREIQRRRGLEGEILEISDREQQRLGRELHDGICQHLTAIAFMARSVALRLKNHRVVEVDDLEKIAQLVNEAAADTRNLSSALHRADVDAAGLADALQDLVDREIWRTPCRLEIKQGFHFDNDAAASQLYRIAREAVINANKHAQAREIVVGLDRSRKRVLLSVTDDGVGFHNGATKVRGLGFHIMNYRAQSIGGRLEIDSPKKGGTRVACYLPAPK